MNNDYQTYEEMADIAESIINGEPLREDVMDSLRVFVTNYSSMQDILSELQSYLKTQAQKNSNGSRLMGSGEFVKALGQSQKVEVQLDRTNKEIVQFIRLMKQALKG